MKRLIMPFIAMACIVLANVTPSQASIENYGIDVASNGTQTVVPFFDESGSGEVLTGGLDVTIFGFNIVLPGESITFVIDSAADIAAGRSVVAAELFIDAFSVDGNNSSIVWIQGVNAGSLANTSSPSDIPVEAGPVGTRVANDDFDVDNTFIDLGAFLTDLETDSDFTIRIENTSNFFKRIRVDGINIQAEVVPEPSMIVIWSLLGLCFGGAKRLRSKQNKGCAC